MNKKELEAKVGIAFAEAVREIKTLELIILQHDLRKTQPEDKYHLELVLLELRERAKKENKNVRRSRNSHGENDGLKKRRT